MYTGNACTRAKRTEIKMSISGLSNHLYVVVTTVVGLLVAPSTLQQARASPGSHDFTESRQFKKNLAVSKYRENPHWLPNYTWKPPEKFHGPRKRPEWEEEPVNESEADRKKKEEFKEWEKKMREVTNTQRQKWKTSSERIVPNATEKTLMPREDSDVRRIVKPEKGGREAQSTSGWTKNLHNGRWGMSVVNSADEYSTSSRRTVEKSSISEPSGEITTTALISNGRWGMSAKGPPKEFTKKLSGASQTSGISGGVWKQDEDPESTGNRKIHDGSEVRVKEAAASATRRATATKLPGLFPSGRWGMSSDLPPGEFLREISRRRPPGIPPGFDKSTAVARQRARAIAKNNPPQSRGLMLPQMPVILTTLIFPQPFPGETGTPPMLPGYSTLQPGIWPSVPDFNVALFIAGRRFDDALSFPKVQQDQTSESCG